MMSDEFRLEFRPTKQSMIKSAKRAIAAVLGSAEVNDQELETIFIGVESLLNSRPLTTVSDDEPVLTPNHFGWSDGRRLCTREC